MELTISMRREKTILVLVFGLIAFGTMFVLTGAVITLVYGIKPGDEGFTQYYDNDRKTPKTPYENLVINGCLKEPIYEDSQSIIMDTKGLDEVGLLYFDPNICFDYAKYITGFSIDNIETDTNGDMVITLTKK